MNKDSSRYSRQIILPQIGKDGQDKLSCAKVLVIGAGGLGCPVLSYLASAGTGTIGILDYDKVEFSNLHRQVLYKESQTGLQKTKAAIDNLKKLNSEIIYIAHDCFLNSKNGFEILKDYDIIVDATDNFKSRYLINDICVILNKPIVTGAINKFEGQVTILNFNNGPTYRCIFPDMPDPRTVSSCEESGVTGALCGLIGTVMSMEVIKIIINSSDLLSGEILFINSFNMEFRKIKIKRNQEAVERAFQLKGKTLP